MGITKPGWSTEFMGVPMNFRKYRECRTMRRLSGNELKKNPDTYEKIGLEDFLNKVVTGKGGYHSANTNNFPTWAKITAPTAARAPTSSNGRQSIARRRPNR